MAAHQRLNRAASTESARRSPSHAPRSFTALAWSSDRVSIRSSKDTVPSEVREIVSIWIARIDATSWRSCRSSSSSIRSARNGR